MNEQSTCAEGDMPTLINLYGHHRLNAEITCHDGDMPTLSIV